MNNLQVKTTKLEPAVINFNHEIVEKELERNLEKYKNLTFTEDNTTELRKTLAELRKWRDVVDDYRKATKRKLNEPVEEFENKCKSLVSKFNDVLDPLNDQLKNFEETRREEKRKAVQEIVDQVIEEFELDHERADEIEIIDSYLTKSKTIKSITDELTAQATNLKLQQDKEKADKSVIETTVKLANSENELSLSVEAYIRLLDFQKVEKVKSQIENDAKKEVEARELAVKRELEKIEREKKAKEEQERLKAIAAAEKEIVKQEEQSNKFEKAFEDVEKVVNNDPINNDLPFPNPFDKEPVFEQMANPFEVKAQSEGLERELSITCTDDEYIKLIDFLEFNNYDWKVLK